MKAKLLNDIWKNNSEIEDRGIRFINGEDSEEFLSYKELYGNSIRILGYLQSVGVKSKEELIFQIDDNRSFIEIFWACIMGGIIPVPVSVEYNEENSTKLFKIWQKLNSPKLITSKFILKNIINVELSDNIKEIRDEIVNKVVLIEDINTTKNLACFEYGKENDIAFIQFSSGSTGDPKGVILTHKNIITNIKDMANEFKMESIDSGLSWIPLTHDMGLIGAHFTQNLMQINQYIMPTSTFMRTPLLWIKKASQYKVTMMASPIFGYTYLLNYLKKDELCKIYDIDLSSVRIMANGAEPIVNKVCDEFLECMSKYKLNKNTIMPIYGLAEATLGVTFTLLNEEVVSIIVDRNSLDIGNKVIERECERDNTVTLIDVGHAIKHCEIRICDDKDSEVNEMIVGHIQISGDNVISGYYNDSRATKNLFTKDGWLKTGDLGFIRNGRLIITGRYKDVLIVNGQNYYVHDIERIVKCIDNIEVQEVVACAVPNIEDGKEELILFLLNKKSNDEFIKVNDKIKDYVLNKIGLEVKEVVPVKEIPKTVSGKIQRYKLAKYYIEGKYKEIIDELNNIRGNNILRETKNMDFTICELEKIVTEIVETVLGIKDVGINENFFELGGQSLKATILVSRIRKELNVEVPLKEIFRLENIRGLSEYILLTSKSEYEAIEKVEEKEYYEVSSAQKRMYMLQELNKDSIAYNLPVGLEMLGKFEISTLNDVFIKLIKRHETFRTSFYSKENKIVQKVHSLEEIEFEIEKIEINSDARSSRKN